MSNSLHARQRRGSLSLVKSLAAVGVTAAALAVGGSARAVDDGGPAPEPVVLCTVDCSKQEFLDYEFNVWADMVVIKANADLWCKAAQAMKNGWMTEAEVILDAIYTFTANGYIVTPEGEGYLIDLLQGCVV